MAQVQNIKIKYTADTGDLTKAQKAIGNLTKAEKEAVKTVEDLNKKSKTATDTVSKGFDKAAKSADKLQKEAKEAGVTLASIGGVIAGAFSVGALVSFGKEVVNITKKFQVYEAVLTNTLGSSSKAQKALNLIKDFAAKTPFSVDKLTESFVKLANQGIVPTEKQFTKLGDIASSTGKDIGQLSEALIKALVGEFEMLKEFGIKASSEGDKVKFTFKGVTTEVDKSSDAIKDYILSLGDAVGVTGSMAAISETLEGKISNLGDTWDAFLLQIGTKSQVVIGKTVGALAEMIVATNELLKTTADKALETEDKVANELLLNRQKNIESYTDFYVKNGDKIEDATKKAYEKEFFYIREGIRLKEEEIEALERKFNRQSGGSASITRNLIDRLKGEIMMQKDSLKSLEEIYNEEVAKFSKKEEEKTKLLKLQLMVRYGEELKQLDFLEQMEIRERKLKEYTEKDIYFIQLKYAKLREDLTKKLAKLDEKNREDLLRKSQSEALRNIELRKDIADWFKFYEEEKTKKYIEEEQKRLKALISSLEKQLDAVEANDDELNQLFQKRVEKDVEITKAIYETTAEIAKEVTRGIFDYENEQRAKQYEILQANKEQELADAGESAEQRKVIEQKYRQEERILRRQDAVARKNQAMFEIALNTAIAVSRALVAPPNAPNVVAAAAAGALGAVQLGIAAARPIPAYKDGTKNHPGGLAVVGDGYKQEMILLPDGTVQLTPDKPTVMDLAKGAMVFPDAKDIDYNRLMANTTITATNETNMKLDKINHTLGNLTKLQVNIDEKGLNKFLIQNTTTTKILNNRYSI